MSNTVRGVCWQCSSKHCSATWSSTLAPGETAEQHRRPCPMCGARALNVTAGETAAPSPSQPAGEASSIWVANRFGVPIALAVMSPNQDNPADPDPWVIMTATEIGEAAPTPGEALEQWSCNPVEYLPASLLVAAASDLADALEDARRARRERDEAQKHLAELLRLPKYELKGRRVRAQAKAWARDHAVYWDAESETREGLAHQIAARFLLPLDLGTPAQWVHDVADAALKERDLAWAECWAKRAPGDPVSERDGLRGRVVELAESLRRVEEVCEEQRAERDSLRADLSRLQTERDALQAEFDGWRADVEAALDDGSGFSYCGWCRTGRPESEREAHAMECDKSPVVIALSAAHQRIAELEGERDEARSRTDSMIAEVARLRVLSLEDGQCIADMRAEKERAQSLAAERLRERDAAMELARRQDAALDTARRAMGALNDSLQTERDALAAQIAEAVAAFDAWASSLTEEPYIDDVRAILTRKPSTLPSSAAGWQHEAADLARCLKEVETERDAYCATLDALRNIWNEISGEGHDAAAAEGTPMAEAWMQIGDLLFNPDSHPLPPPARDAVLDLAERERVAGLERQIARFRAVDPTYCNREDWACCIGCRGFYPSLVPEGGFVHDADCPWAPDTDPHPSADAGAGDEARGKGVTTDDWRARAEKAEAENKTLGDLVVRLHDVIENIVEATGYDPESEAVAYVAARSRAAGVSDTSDERGDTDDAPGGAGEES